MADDTFITIQVAKERFEGVKSTATFMRLMHKLKIPYYKPSAKMVLFDKKVFDKKIAEWKSRQQKIFAGIGENND